MPIVVALAVGGALWFLVKDGGAETDTEQASPPSDTQVKGVSEAEAKRDAALADIVGAFGDVPSEGSEGSSTSQVAAGFNTATAPPPSGPRVASAAMSGARAVSTKTVARRVQSAIDSGAAGGLLI